MTQTERAFLLAAAAAPGDDALRLVYSDWLEEQPGDAATAHAEFVRLQVARARLVRESPGQPVAATRRERFLEHKYRRSWNGRVHRLLRDLGVPHRVDARRGGIRGWDYCRGMVASLTLPADSLVDLFWAVPQLGPVRRLVVHDWPPVHYYDAMELFFGPQGPKLLTVAFRGGRNPDSLQDLVGRVPIIELKAWGEYRFSRWEDMDGFLPVVDNFRGHRHETRTMILIRHQPIADRVGLASIIDPQNIWPQYRAEFAELTGFTDDPTPYRR